MFFFQLYKKLDQLKKAVIFHILYMYKNVQKERFGLYSRRERLHFIPGHKQVSICSNRWLNEKKTTPAMEGKATLKSPQFASLTISH